MSDSIPTDSNFKTVDKERDKQQKMKEKRLRQLHKLFEANELEFE